MLTGRECEWSGSAGRFAAHPTSLRTRPLHKFLQMVQETGWTVSVMLGTIQRQHPLVDIDFHSAGAKQHYPHVTAEKLAAAAMSAQQRLFQCNDKTERPYVMQPGQGGGYHIVVMGCVISGKHGRITALDSIPG